MNGGEPNYDSVLPKVVETVRAASALAAQDVSFYRSLDQNLLTELEDTGKSLLSLANKLMSEISPEIQAVEYGAREIQSGFAWKRITGVLDVCFEKVDMALDAIKHSTSSSGQSSMTQSIISDVNELLPEVKEKPQKLFRVEVDNSDASPFKPKLKQKPHALKSLADSLQVVTNGSEESSPHYLHPYEFEIMKQPYPESILEHLAPILPQDWNTSTHVWVDTKDKLHSMLQELANVSEIAVDLEHHDYRSFYGITCLMQISSRESDWLIDTLALRDDLEVLNEIFANPSIVKVFHGASMDIIWLQRDLGLYVVSLFDTYHASKKLGFPKFSLAYLLETFAHFKTSKKYQLADWRIRPLTSTMSQYARADTHFLLHIYDILKNKLIDRGSLHEVLHDSRRVACRRFEYLKFRNDWNNWPGFNLELNSLQILMSQHNISSSKKALLDALLAWRDVLARKLDESHRYILPTNTLISLCALSMPISIGKVKSAIGISSKLLGSHLEELFDILNKTPAEGFTPLPESCAVRSPHVDYQTAIALSETFSALKDPRVIDNPLISELSSSHNPISFRISDQPFSVKFNVPKMIQKIDKQEVGARLELLRETFHTCNSDALFQKSSGSATIEADNSDPQSPVDDIPVGDDERPPHSADSSKLVVLSEKNRTRRKRTQTVSNDPVYDYNSPENANILSGNSHGAKKKKRSFDPFSAAGSGGPRAAKRNRSIAPGKSTSFKNGKK